jgi:exopolysaccharide/PEP-CTERM locus tyrosine autokinase
MNGDGDTTASTRIVPAKHICFDRAALVDAGVLPDGQHQEMISQQFRRIKRPVLQCAFDENLQVGNNANIIMIASALPGAGKSFCSLSLANSIATERDFGAVLVDADVLKPGLTRAFGLDDQIGLIDYLADPAIGVADVLVATDMNDVIIIPAGRSHPQATELLASQRMHKFVAALSETFPRHTIILDTPPLLLTNEAQVLAETAGQIVLIIESRVSSQESVMQALSMLDRSKPINAILNKSRGASKGGYQGDGYGYYPYKGRSDYNATAD